MFFTITMTHQCFCCFPCGEGTLHVLSSALDAKEGWERAWSDSQVIEGKVFPLLQLKILIRKTKSGERKRETISIWMSPSTSCVAFDINVRLFLPTPRPSHRLFLIVLSHLLNQWREKEKSARALITSCFSLECLIARKMNGDNIKNEEKKRTVRVCQCFD